VTPFDRPIADLALTLAVGVLVAVVLARLVRLAIRRSASTRPVLADMSRRGHRPFELALVLVAVTLVLERTGPGGSVPGVVSALLRLALIGVVGWLVGVLAFVLEDLALARYRIDVADNRRARRVRTQVSILRRLTVAVVVVVAVGSMLLTLPGARAAGTSLLASAGLISVVAGLAAQSSLANVFAGLQLAFTDAMRVDDVVVVQKEWGRIEEITLTYVVVHVWDDRRLVLPSTYFTTTPFENWTRRNADLLGTVEFDLDWTAPFAEMREELRRIVAATPLWDERVAVLQLTDATSSFVRVRVLVSGVDGPTVFDLRCHVREALVRWLQAEHPHAFPQLRTATAAIPHPRSTARGHRERGQREAGRRETGRDGTGDEGADPSRLFTSPEGARRFRAFTGQGMDPDDDRTRVAVQELAALDGVDDTALPPASRQPQQSG